MTKLRLLIIFLTALIIISCDNSDTISLQGNWIKQAEFIGEPRTGAVCFTLGNEAYVGTGYHGEKCLRTFYKYNLQDGWTKIAVFPGKARQEAVAFTINGKGYVGTGVDIDGNRLKDFYEYDPTTNTWKEAPEFVGGARQGAIAFAINNIGYVGTGYGVLDGEDENYLQDFFKFENGKWERMGFYLGYKVANSTSFVINNKAYLISGEGNYFHTWEFDPNSSTNKYNGWSFRNKLIATNNSEFVNRQNALSFVINNKGYVATGVYGPYNRTVWEYEPDNDKWIEKTALEQEIFSRENAVGFSINNRGFIVTGNIAEHCLDDMWEFNPTMDKTDDDNRDYHE